MGSLAEIKTKFILFHLVRINFFLQPNFITIVYAAMNRHRPKRNSLNRCRSLSVSRSASVSAAANPKLAAACLDIIRRIGKRKQRHISLFTSVASQQHHETPASRTTSVMIHQRIEPPASQTTSITNHQRHEPPVSRKQRHQSRGSTAE